MEPRSTTGKEGNETARTSMQYHGKKLSPGWWNVTTMGRRGGDNQSHMCLVRIRIDKGGDGKRTEGIKRSYLRIRLSG
jgi:hypothetical protein